MWIAYWYFMLLLMTLIYGIEIDTSRALATHAVLQGGMDAATLAGATQNQEIVTFKDDAGAPINYQYVLKDDSSPEDAAWTTWYKNVYNWPEQIGQGATVQFWRTPDNKGMAGSVTQDWQATFTSHVVDGWFGQGSAPDSTVHVQSQAIAKVFP